MTNQQKFISGFLILSLGAFIAGCNPPPLNQTNTDSVVADSGPKKTMTVTTPIAPVPKQAADSIWNGDYVEKYSNGMTKKRGYISGGLATGEWMTFYDDGKPWSRGTYHDGVRTGYGISWYHDGQKSSEGYYNNGKMVGMWNYWSESTHQLSVKDYGGVLPDTTRR